MFRKSVSLFELFAFLSLLFTSCAGDSAVQPRKRASESGAGIVGAGELHNEILTAYADGRNLLRMKLTNEEGTRLFIDAANNVLGKRGIDFRVDEDFVNSRIREFARLKDECGYDIFNPGSDPELVFSYLERSGAIAPERAQKLRACWQDIKGSLISPGQHPRLDSIEPVPNDHVIDIGECSAQWWCEYYGQMEEYVAQHPELQEWWDSWKKKIREWGLIGSDMIGALVGLGAGGAGAIVGAALASIAFTIAWPPD